MALKQPPEVNGIMDLTDTEIQDIQTKLLAIQTAFVPTDEQPTCDTFYLTANYNQQNPTSLINGDTCQYVLAWQPAPAPAQ